MAIDAFDTVIIPNQVDVTDNTAPLRSCYIIIAHDADIAFTEVDAVSVNSLTELDSALTSDESVIVLESGPGGRTHDWVTVIVAAARIVRTEVLFVTGLGETTPDLRNIMFEFSTLDRVDYSRIKRDAASRHQLANDAALALKAAERSTTYGKVVDSVRNKHGIIKKYDPANEPEAAPDVGGAQ